MKPKHDLLVFSKREVFVVLLLLVVVALFSFTIGLRMGKSLQPQAHHDETTSSEAPLHEADPATEEKPHADAHEKPVTDGHATGDEDGHKKASKNSHRETDVKPDAERPAHGTEESSESKSHDDPPKSPEEHGANQTNKTVETAGEKMVEEKLAKEMEQSGIKSQRPVVTDLPQGVKGKKNSAASRDAAGHDASGSSYTLQVGAHRAISEATDQVAVLKRQGFENAFYFEARIPDKGTWYRVGLGVYESRNDAETAGRQLKSKQNAPDFIVQKMEK